MEMGVGPSRGILNILWDGGGEKQVGHTKALISPPGRMTALDASAGNLRTWANP